jgi:hypothetical protein
MLIGLGAATNSVTARLETPLLLATTPISRQHMTRRFHTSQRNSKDASSIDTIRLLVHQGDNDPMQPDDIGFNSIVTASGDCRNPMLPWLLNQEEYEVDVGYKTPSGHTTGAYISTRVDFPELLPALIEQGINVNDPCAKHWLYRFGPQIDLGGRFGKTYQS